MKMTLDPINTTPEIIINIANPDFADLAAWRSINRWIISKPYPGSFYILSKTPSCIKSKLLPLVTYLSVSNLDAIAER